MSKSRGSFSPPRQGWSQAQVQEVRVPYLGSQKRQPTSVILGLLNCYGKFVLAPLHSAASETVLARPPGIGTIGQGNYLMAQFCLTISLDQWYPYLGLCSDGHSHLVHTAGTNLAQMPMFSADCPVLAKDVRSWTLQGPNYRLEGPCSQSLHTVTRRL